MMPQSATIFVILSISVSGICGDKGGKFYIDEKPPRNNDKATLSTSDWLVKRVATLESYLINEVNDLKGEMISALKLNSNVTSLNMQVEMVRWNLQEMTRNFAKVKSNAVPVGFVYMQLPNEKEPSEVFSGMTWKEIKEQDKNYEAVEFRYKPEAIRAWRRIK
ncbi:uncharacterized protein LOC110849930 [Folsomia candida]|uniref:uncharacterized protein LOC110849930 n=1 Tax=Folsomia candida TaxID=158441 RepID=UPI000B8F3B10|nr:uncharacterized protein LOC110849930 [Folsomia candida]